jgi:putative ABC transport system ATP-binding protein
LKKLSVLDNIILPGYKLNQKSRDEVERDALGLMEKTEISSIAKHDIKKVSGGQLQRAAICRALINQPKILFGDEPTGALNSSTMKEVMDIFNAIHRQKTTIVIVTHDTKVAHRADRIVFLVDGRIEDELRLGSYSDETNHSVREQTLSQWLEKLNF